MRFRFKDVAKEFLPKSQSGRQVQLHGTEADISFIPSDANKGKPFGYSAAADWDRTMTILKDYRDLKTDKPATAFYTNDYLPKE